jgi:molybdopterin-guanine dinucleotide biosynthesis protein A
VEKRTCEICILAGGLSRRMGKDKARLRLGRRTLLARIRAEARATGLPVRVIRRDAVPRCGPLGGIYTALQTTRAEAVLLLACDMPFVTAQLLQLVLDSAADQSCLFVRSNGVAGFPFLLSRASLPTVTAQVEAGRFSLQVLAKALEAKLVRLPRRLSPQLRNINTPAELRRARRLWEKRPGV